MPQKARLGDPSNHGGRIISASTDVIVNGIGAARTGDMHSCPIKGHGITALTSTSTVHVDGRSVIRVGDLAGCGAAISSGSPSVNSFHVTEFGASVSVFVPPSIEIAAAAAAQQFNPASSADIIEPAQSLISMASSTNASALVSFFVLAAS